MKFKLQSNLIFVASATDSMYLMIYRQVHEPVKFREEFRSQAILKFQCVCSLNYRACHGLPVKTRTYLNGYFNINMFFSIQSGKLIHKPLNLYGRKTCWKNFIMPISLLTKIPLIRQLTLVQNLNNFIFLNKLRSNRFAGVSQVS